MPTPPRFRTQLLACLAGAASLTAAHAEVHTIACDGIAYTAGDEMEHRDGGEGWGPTSAWRFDYYYGANFVVAAQGLTCAELTTTGGAMT